MIQEINKNENPKRMERNRFFSPILEHNKNINRMKTNDNSFNTTENLFYQKKFSKRLNSIRNSERINYTTNMSKQEKEIKGNLFLHNYRAKIEEKEKRIDEDRKDNYYFEIQNFDKNAKIKDAMTIIFNQNFVQKNVWR